MCDEIRSHHDWITEPLPCSPPEQTSKLFVSFAEQIPAISYWSIFVILVVVPLTGACTFFFCWPRNYGGTKQVFKILSLWICCSSGHVWEYRYISRYLKDNTWKGGTYKSPLFHLRKICIFYPTFFLRIPLTQLRQKDVLNYSLTLNSILIYSWSVAFVFIFGKRCGALHLLSL